MVLFTYSFKYKWGLVIASNKMSDRVRIKWFKSKFTQMDESFSTCDHLTVDL